eukprot:2266022-Pyramimonas_sp.AAC.1
MPRRDRPSPVRRCWRRRCHRTQHWKGIVVGHVGLRPQKREMARRNAGPSEEQFLQRYSSAEGL